MITIGKVRNAIRDNEYAIADHAEHRCYAFGVSSASLIGAMLVKTERVIHAGNTLIAWVIHDGTLYSLTWSNEVCPITLRSVSVNEPFGLRLYAEPKWNKTYEADLLSAA